MMSMKDMVSKYRPNRVNDITDQQIAYIPRLEENQVECIVPYYIFDGMKVAPSTKSSIIFKLRYINFNNNMNSIKRRNYRSCRDKLKNLIDKKVLKPFMLFINGCFIPWEVITIVINNEESYIIVDFSTSTYCTTYTLETLYRICNNCSYVQTFSIPENSIYLKRQDCVNRGSEIPMFVFNEFLTYETKPGCGYYAIQILDNNIEFGRTYSDTVSAYPLYSNDEKIKITEKNVFIFVDGSLQYGTPKHIHTCSYSNNHIIYNNDQYENEPYEKFIPIRIDGNLLTTNNGYRHPYSTVIWFKNNSFTSDNLDNIMRISEESRIEGVKTDKAYFHHLSRPFDLDIDIHATHDINTQTSEDFINSYNQYLFNELVKSYSTIDVQEFVGSEILKMSKASGNISVALDNSNNNEERVLVFVDGIFYEGNSTATINKNTINIPISSNMDPDSVVEFMRFKDVNNDKIELVINENDGFIHKYGKTINENMHIFCNMHHDGYNNYPADGNQMFEVEYTLEKDDNGYVKIVLTVPYYYGKLLTIVSDRRFVHKSFTIDQDYTNAVLMENHFKFCTNVNRYMVFSNGRLVDKKLYTLIIPDDPKSKEFNFVLFFYEYTRAGDRIDIVYTSIEFEEFIAKDKIDSSGDIIVEDIESLDYIFSRELYLFWINGKKIPMSQLDDINNTCVRINTDQRTLRNLKVMKHIKYKLDIPYDNCIWEYAIFNGSYTYDEINKIIGKYNAVLTDMETDYSNDGSDLRAWISANVLMVKDLKNVMSAGIVNDGSSVRIDDPSKNVDSNINNDILYIT